MSKLIQYLQGPKIDNKFLEFYEIQTFIAANRSKLSFLTTITSSAVNSCKSW
jgi:hypothetical protein